jgi:hypothetical protein
MTTDLLDRLRHHCGERDCDECETRREAALEIERMRAEIQRINAERSDDITIAVIGERERVKELIGEDSRWRARVEPLLRELLEAETQWRAFCQQVADATGNTLYHSHRSAALFRALDDVTRNAKP